MPKNFIQDKTMAQILQTKKNYWPNTTTTFSSVFLLIPHLSSVINSGHFRFRFLLKSATFWMFGAIPRMQFASHDGLYLHTPM